jgi:hypothetical protein
MALELTDYTEPLSALEKQERREEKEQRAAGPTWFAIIDGKDERQTVGRVLVVSGRIASHSWGLSYIGREWADERARVEGRNGWTVEEMPNV